MVNFKSYKKYYVMVVGAFLVTPFFVSAQVEQLSDSFTDVQTACVDLKYNMGYRSRDSKTNGEVTDLQDFLISSGYLSGIPTGYFGLVTIAAVKKFQTAVGIGRSTIPGYGAVGPKSRAKIKEITCNNSTITTTATTLNATTPSFTSTTTATKIPVIGGQVSVSLSNDSPVAGAVVAGQVIADLAHFAFAGSGTLETVKLVRTGISSNSTLSNVYLYNGNVRVSDGVSVNNIDGTIIFNNLNTATPAVLSVKADISINGEGQIVGVQLVGYRVSGATTMTSASVSGNYMNVASSSYCLTSVAGVSAGTSSSCSLTPAIKIIQPITSIVAGGIITASWSANYQTSLVSATLYNPSTKLTYYSGPLGKGVVGDNFVNLPAEASNVPPAKYTLTICDFNSSQPSVRPLCVSTQFDVIKSTNETPTATILIAPRIDEIYTNVPVTTSVPTFTIKGVLFDTIANKVSVNGITMVLPSKNIVASSGAIIGMGILLNPSDFNILSSGSYAVKVSTAGGVSNSLDLNIVVSDVVPVASINVPPVLKLTYDVNNKEASLLAGATVSVKAGSKDLLITKPGQVPPGNSYGYFAINVFDGAGHFGVSSQNLDVLQVGSVAQDNVSYWTLKSGMTEEFFIGDSLNLKQMFAGTYHAEATFYNVVNNSSRNILTNPLVGNQVTVVGEVSPYINSITADPLTGLIKITGVRFTSTGNTVSVLGGKSITVPSTALGNTVSSCTGSFVRRCVSNFIPNGSWMISVKPSDIGITAPVITPIQVATLEGASNAISVDIKIIASNIVSNQLASVAEANPEQLPTSLSAWNYNWTRNLEVNSPYTDDVSALQTALVKEGVYSGEVTGGFYRQTYLAVKALQAKYGIETTGFVGQVTRSLLNELY